ncbi:Bug family tripartite tricarboxylate transporter substrate binding protein [Cupriavidus sp. IDO]|uniref:Bug family tripartite tricarboxylate transporter substrate binding protein n=1 Tax=Cupriavidus sp. IDO TaxID=1539142 RepID=UPI0005791A7A|nr:tripartite tricarboxylate transporter substrate binding protein [Cupriavidus sp. IDO]KWR83772.1 LacI family transcriptional regulator [Cupriavidus sp. IDO]
MKSIQQRIARVIGAVVLAACAATTLAEGAYPSRPIRMIVPWPAGGSVDIATRVVTERVSAELGQPVIVENRPGAAGNIGAQAAAKSAPDGYTLLVATTPMIINRSLEDRLPYDLARDFSPISTLVTLNYVLVVNPSVAGSVQDLVRKAKAQPGRITYASSGPGTQLHLIGEAFRKQTGVDIVHVPYKGAPPALADMVGGHIAMMFPGFPVVEPLLKSGQLKALAVVGKHRLPGLPEIPTLAEAGVPGIDSVEWYGVVAPAGTPGNIVTKLNDEFEKALRNPAVRKRLASHGFEPAGSTQQAFADLIQAEQRKWPIVVRQAGLHRE